MIKPNPRKLIKPIFALSGSRLYRRCHKVFEVAEADNSLEIYKQITWNVEPFSTMNGYA